MTLKNHKKEVYSGVLLIQIKKKKKKLFIFYIKILFYKFILKPKKNL